MEALLTQAFIVSLLFGAMKAGLPLLLAGLGEQVSEKAGVLNIGIEGMMLFGAYAGFVAAYYSGSFWLGFLFGGIGGAAVAAIVVLLCIRYGLNQIVIGIGVTIGMEGLTALLHYFQFSKTYPRLDEIPDLSHHVVVYLSLALVVALTWLFRATYVGLNLEAAGNKPAALDAAGVSVLKTRAYAVLTTGFLAGVGGAYMANVGAGLFVPFMTGGAGFIGIVLAMLARGKPVWVLLGAALFGISLAMTTALQVAGINIPTDVVQMLPFAMVMLVLVIFARHSVLPPALGLPYVRGER
ncbi:MAG TPA: ABC transporter permease [Dongiaceae bacterium]|jgi:simple sugar transport system permease protein|nr:ABC transporter permease [Dongiaceae bacterium]